MHFMDYGYHTGYGGIFMWLIFIVVIGLAAYFIVQATNNQSGSNSSKTPIEILKERYARGEITKEEYDKIKKDLRD